MNDQTVREIRVNPIVPTESVLIATARGQRPRKAEVAAPAEAREHVADCPFCPGNEHLTPPTLFSVSQDGDWQARVVENLYPVLADSAIQQSLSLGLQQIIFGYGRHEVIIDHRNHGISLHAMADAHLALLFGCYRERMAALYDSDPRIRYVLVFKNFGPAAGASIRHTHSQIIALPVAPQNVLEELAHSQAYHRKSGQCIFCSLIDEALSFEVTVYDRHSGQIRRRIEIGQYVIERSERFVAIKPFASRYEWEMMVLPLVHESDFRSLSADDALDLAGVLRRAMARLDKVLGGVQYNFFLHSVPCGDEGIAHRKSYHWHLEICPRTSIPTGFELGSGLFVSTVSPEDAAARLRNVKIEAS